MVRPLMIATSFQRSADGRLTVFAGFCGSLPAATLYDCRPHANPHEEPHSREAHIQPLMGQHSHLAGQKV